MHLDDHRIVIRERGYLELLDLGLRVLRSQGGPFFLALAAGFAPFIALNAFLLNRFAKIPTDGSPPALFLALMLVAVLWEVPLASAPATMCLGRVLFNQPLDARQIAREFLRSLPQLIVYQVVLRGFLFATVAFSFVPFIASPYLNEVILLERNPYRASRNQPISTGQRSSMLHRGQGGDFFARWLLNALIALVLVTSFWGTLAMASKWLLNEQDWTTPFYTCLYPAALWSAAAYFMVVRFLGYLDLRIRREGWEVELLMRAERERWTRIPQAS
jgi:hypothetical protein